MSIDLKAWKDGIARIGDTAEPKLYIGDVRPFESEGVPDFIGRPTREFAVLPVFEIGANEDQVLARNRRVIEAVAATGLCALQLAVEWESADGVSYEPAVVAVSQESGFAAVAFEGRLAEVRRALGGSTTHWISCDAEGLWVVGEGSRVELPKIPVLEALSEGYGRLYEGRSGLCQLVGLTRPQNSLSGLLFSRIGLSYD